MIKFMKIASPFQGCLALLNVENIDIISSIVSLTLTFAREMIRLACFSEDGVFWEGCVDCICVAC